jgi:hypothetical protein
MASPMPSASATCGSRVTCTPGLPLHIAQELDAWIRHMPDENVRSRRPFMVVKDEKDGLTAFVFAPKPKRPVPAWWRAALAAWQQTHAEVRP